MWLVGEYEITSLFSLKAATATSSGGKSLLVPTPFAIKMALLDVACRVEGEAVGRNAWSWLRSLKIALQPPKYAVVSNTFTKILKPRRGEAGEGDVDAGPYQRTIGYREYVQFVGPLGIAFNLGENKVSVNQLILWMSGINYFGKRGSFAQLIKKPLQTVDLPKGYVETFDSQQASIPLQGVLNLLDDCDGSISFDQISIYSSKSMRRDKDRILRPVVLPYRVVSSSRGYTFYERFD